MKPIDVDVSYQGTTTRVPIREALLLLKNRERLIWTIRSINDGDLVRAEHRDGGTMTIKRQMPRKAREGDDDNPPSPDDDDEKPRPRPVQFEIPVAFPLQVTGSAYVMAENRDHARQIVEYYAGGGLDAEVQLDFTETSLTELRHKLDAIKRGHVNTVGEIRVAGEPHPSAQYLLTHG